MLEVIFLLLLVGGLVFAIRFGWEAADALVYKLFFR